LHATEQIGVLALTQILDTAQMGNQKRINSASERLGNSFMKPKLISCSFTCAGMAVALFHSCNGLAHAAPVLDQSYLPPGLVTISDSQQYAQTFTSTLAGKLAQVDVVIVSVRGTETTFEIRPVAGGIPVADNSRVLATLPVPEVTNLTETGVISFDLTPFSIPVKPGDVLAFNLIPGLSTGSITLRLGDEDLAGNPDYVGGALFRRPSSPLSPPFEIFPVRADIKFQTFVDTAIPEPTGLALSGIGLAAVGLLTLRQRQSPAEALTAVLL
jgi:hypothetical protein